VVPDESLIFVAVALVGRRRVHLLNGLPMAEARRTIGSLLRRPPTTGGGGVGDGQSRGQSADRGATRSWLIHRSSARAALTGITRPGTQSSTH